MVHINIFTIMTRSWTENQRGKKWYLDGDLHVLKKSIFHKKEYIMSLENHDGVDWIGGDCKKNIILSSVCTNN